MTSENESSSVVDCPECGNPVAGEECRLCGWRPGAMGSPPGDPEAVAPFASAQEGMVKIPPDGAQRVPGASDLSQSAAATPQASAPPPPPARPAPASAQGKAGWGKFLVALLVLGAIVGMLVAIGNGVSQPSAYSPSRDSTASGGSNDATDYPVVRVAAGKECARVGSGPFAAVGTGNKTTSCAFAVKVRTAYVKKFPSGEPGTVEARSPTTKKNYKMSCSGSQPVSCTGGVAAVVLIYGGTLEVG